MTGELAKFTLRVDAQLLKKFKYIAESNARSANRELEIMMRRRVEKFEEANGKIELDK
jgi:hypothetical protein